MPLVINGLEADTQTHIPMCEQKQFQESGVQWPQADAHRVKKVLSFIFTHENKLIAKI